MLENLGRFLIDRRWIVLSVILGLTGVFGWFASQIRVESPTIDLFPTTHPYVETFVKYSEVFGGASRVAIQLEAKDGDIFKKPTLDKIRRITKELELLEGINNYQVLSLAQRKIKELKVDSIRGFRAVPVMWPKVPETAEEIAKLRTAFDFFRPGRLTLDLCCGTGRHAAPLGEMQLQLIGYDLSPDLLDRARKRPALVGRIVRGDMRRLPFGTHFHLVVNLFTSFGYFPTDEENEQVLTEMGRVLVPRGHLVLDHINAARLRAHLIGEDVRRGPGVQITQRRRLSGSRVLKDVTIERQGRATLQYQENVRLYDPDEIRSQLESRGFRDVRFAGGFDGRPFAEDSPRMLVVARKGE